MVSEKKITGIRLRAEEKKLLRTIAKTYDVSESDVMRIALKEYAKKCGIEVPP